MSITALAVTVAFSFRTRYERWMAHRTALFVTVDGNSATITSTVRSTHRTLKAAQLAARLAGRVAVSAEVARDMQNGLSFSDAECFYAGKAYEPARVWVS